MAAVIQAPEIFPVNDGRGFGFSSKDLNAIARAQYMDTFDFWQRQFGLYGFMKMNKLNKFIVWSPQGHPLMLQPYNACSVEPTGSLTMGKRELEPDKAQMFEKFCHDELFDSCFEHWVEFMESGMVDLDENGRAMFGQLVDELLANAALSVRLGLTSGNFYDVSTVEFSPENTANISSLFTRTHGTFTGWVKVALDASQTNYPWLNESITTAADFDENGYTGNIIDLYDSLRLKAKRPFQQVINQGGISRGGRFSFTPLMVVSDSYFNAVISQWNAYATQTATNRTRLSVREFGAQNGASPNRVFYIDQTPIVPLSDIAGFDQYVNAQTHFAGIVGSGNIQMGLSFSGIPQDIENGLAMMLAKVTDSSRSDYGNYTFRTHLLGKAAIADPDYMVSTITTTTVDAES